MLFTIEWLYCKCYTPWSWPTFLWPNIANVNGEIASAKMCYGFYICWYLPLNNAIVKVVFSHLDQLFQGQLLQVLISLKWWQLAQMCPGFYRFCYLLSYGASAKVVLHDLDLRFQGQICQMLISQKWWELVQKCVMGLLHILIFAIESSHCKSNAQWPWPTFLLFLRSIISSVNISETVGASVKMLIMICFHLYGTCC